MNVGDVFANTLVNRLRLSQMKPSLIVIVPRLSTIFNRRMHAFPLIIQSLPPPLLHEKVALNSQYSLPVNLQWQQ